MKKYEITDDFKTINGIKLYRLKALTSFGDVKAGDFGGYIEKEENLSQYGNAWVYGNAGVYGNAKVSGNAKVGGNAWVYGNAWVSINAEVYGDAKVSSNADYIAIKGLGSVFRTTTIFKDSKRGLAVKCGCFFGDLFEFEAKVKETHGDGKYAQEYIKLIELAKIHFEEN